MIVQNVGIYECLKYVSQLDWSVWQNLYGEKRMMQMRSEYLFTLKVTQRFRSNLQCFLLYSVILITFLEDISLKYRFLWSMVYHLYNRLLLSMNVTNKTWIHASHIPSRGAGFSVGETTLVEGLRWTANQPEGGTIKKREREERVFMQHAAAINPH